MSNETEEETVMNTISQSWDIFKETEGQLIDKINAIHKSQATLESTLIDLDMEADTAIEQLHELQRNYYGEDEQ